MFGLSLTMLLGIMGGLPLPVAEVPEDPVDLVDTPVLLLERVVTALGDLSVVEGILGFLGEAALGLVSRRVAGEG